MAEAINRSGILDDYPTIDGVVPFVHGTGCAMDLKGEGFKIFRRTQWGYACNPNLGGTLLVGLGCEAFQIGKMKEVYGIEESDTFQTMAGNIDARLVAGHGALVLQPAPEVLGIVGIGAHASSAQTRAAACRSTRRGHSD